MEWETSLVLYIPRALHPDWRTAISHWLPHRCHIVVLSLYSTHFYSLISLVWVRYKSLRAMCLDLCWIPPFANSSSLTSPLKTINAPLYRPLLSRFVILSIQCVWTEANLDFKWNGYVSCASNTPIYMDVDAWKRLGYCYVSIRSPTASAHGRSPTKGTVFQAPMPHCPVTKVKDWRWVYFRFGV